MGIGFSGLHAAILVAPTVPGRLGNFQLSTDLGDVVTSIEQLLALGEFADDLVGCVMPSLHGESSCSIVEHQDSQNQWLSSGGSFQTVQVLRKSFALQLTLTQIPRCAQGAIVFGLARKRTRVAEALANTLSCTSDELVRFKPHPVGISSVITASVFKHHG